MTDLEGRITAATVFGESLFVVFDDAPTTIRQIPVSSDLLPGRVSGAVVFNGRLIVATETGPFELKREGWRKIVRFGENGLEGKADG